jgi:hypothetical protein
MLAGHEGGLRLRDQEGSQSNAATDAIEAEGF